MKKCVCPIAKNEGDFCVMAYCAWWEEKKKQCAVLTLAQKVNFNVRVAR